MWGRAGFIVAGLVAVVAVRGFGAQLTTLASFNRTNGANPWAGVVLSDGVLYGITTGLDTKPTYSGNVFSVPVGGGTPSVLTSFGIDEDQNLLAEPLLSGGMLYWGQSGGLNFNGAVYSMPVTGGTPTVLGTFNGANGSGPSGGLILSNGVLYGTTSGGGANNDGVVFSVPVGGGTPTALASFSGANGAMPKAGVILSGGKLYGTTFLGGANDDGEVFSVPVGGGTPTVLASFDGANGMAPESKLVISGGTLYGTTWAGGTTSIVAPDGYGEVFSVPIDGGEPNVLASFNGSNGMGPREGLLLSGDTLYGTAEQGGLHNDGAVYSVPIEGGAPTVLASFNGFVNGSQPEGGLIISGNTLYGTTAEGGDIRIGGYGTVFALALPEPGVGMVAVLGLGAVMGRRRKLRMKGMQKEE